MSVIATEMQGIVYRASEPISPGETVKAQIKRAWETLGRPPYWRVRAAWYGEAGCWVAVATEDFRARDARRRRKEEAGRAQANELAQTYLAASARLREIDEDFHSTEIARLERVAREVGAVDRAVAETPE